MWAYRSQALLNKARYRAFAVYDKLYNMYYITVEDPHESIVGRV